MHRKHTHTHIDTQSCSPRVFSADSGGVNQMRAVPSENSKMEEKREKNKENYAKDFHTNDATEN